MSELHDLTALEQGAAIRAGETSSSELVEHYLGRIERHSETLGAFITVTGDAARREASSVSADGPLAGVPTAIKDLNATAGVRTTYGSAAFADNVPDFDDEVVVRIRRAGLVSLGKTNTPELGSPCYTEPDVAPPAVTPWDLTRTAGGSSGGAGAAVAGGLVPLAQGSDGGGSIRIPASCCGLVGLKPSRGRISGAPMYADPVGLATSGPLARTVRDAAALLDVMAGRAVGDPFWAPEPAGSFLAACDQPTGRLRVAMFSTPVITEVDVDAECVAAYQQTARLLDGMGHHLEEIEMPLDPSAVPVFEDCWSVLTALSVVNLSSEQQRVLRPLTRWLADRGRAVSAPDFGLAIGALRRFAAEVLHRLSSYDLVLTPTLAQLPAKVGAIRNDDDPAADFLAQKRFTPYTSLWNVTGSPAISLPIHQSPGNLPVGVMIAAAPGRDALLLRVAAQLEGSVGWRSRLPGIWAQ